MTLLKSSIPEHNDRSVIIEVLTKFRKEITQDDLKDVASFIRDRGKFDRKTDLFSDFVKVIAKRAFPADVARYL